MVNHLLLPAGIQDSKLFFTKSDTNVATFRQILGNVILKMIESNYYYYYVLCVEETDIHSLVC